MTARRIRRPFYGATRDVVDAYYRTVAGALDDLGVDYGDEFVVARAGVGLPDDVEAASRAGDPSTSRRAARDVTPRVSNLHGRILAVVAEFGHGTPRGLTHAEVRDLARVSQATVGPRLAELKRAGYLVEAGERVNAESGSAQAIHALTDLGQVAARDLVRDDQAVDNGPDEVLFDAPPASLPHYGEGSA